MKQAADHFRDMVRKNSPGGRPFKSFSEGVIGAEEGYKARLAPVARARLGAEEWLPSDIGSGKILEAAIAAIEIDEPGMRNNLLEWQGRNGPAGNDHRKLTEAREDIKRRKVVEAVLYNLLRNEGEDEAVFLACAQELGAIYPLVTYLWFLRDPTRFVPVRPKGLQIGLKKIGIDLKLVQKCSWPNYTELLETLNDLRPMIADVLGLESVSLMEAHSFVWVVGNWVPPREGQSSLGRSYGDIEKAAFIMARRVSDTVAGANGQIVQKTVKPKDTDLSFEELKEHLSDLLAQADGKCQVSGLPLLLPPNKSDPDMVASVDRINSDIGYVKGNLQVVCWFINRWKSDDDAGNFLRLIELVKSTNLKAPVCL